MKNQEESIEITDPTVIESFKKEIRRLFGSHLHLQALFRAPYCKIRFTHNMKKQTCNISFSAVGEFDFQKINISPSLMKKESKLSTCIVVSNGVIYEPVAIPAPSVTRFLDHFGRLHQAFYCDYS